MFTRQQKLLSILWYPPKRCSLEPLCLYFNLPPKEIPQIAHPRVLALPPPPKPIIQN